VNTLGAVAGCLAAGFVLIAQYGIRSSLLVAAAMNLVVAAVAVCTPSGSRALVPRSTPLPSGHRAPDRDERVVLGLFFLTGFAALGYEVLWTRALLVYLESSVYAFSLMLGVYLLGVALGSTAASPLAGRARRPLVGLAIAQVGVVASVAAGLLVFPELRTLGLNLVGATRIDSFERAIAMMLTQASLVLLLPTICMGAMFPFGVAAYHRALRGVGRSVGSLYAVNTLGNITGAIVVGFLLIEALGVRHSLIAMLGLNALVAVLVTWREAASLHARVLSAVAASATLFVIHLGVSDQIFYRAILRTPTFEVVFYREGASDTVSVLQSKSDSTRRILVYADGRGAAGTGSLPWNLYFGHLPMLLHPDPQQILHICYGSGNSVMALTRHDPERIDVVELSPHVRETSHFFWTNEGVIDDPRVNLIIEDGRNFLLGTERSYDVISLEPPSVAAAGVVNLFTREFYDLARRHLSPGGVMTQWLPTLQLSTADRAHLIRSFADAFPHVAIFQQLIGPTLLLVGTLEPLAIDVDELGRRLALDALRKDAIAMRTPTPELFLSYFLLGDESTRELTAGYEPVLDDRTIVDYSIPHFVGGAFGFSPLAYRIGSEEENPAKVIRQLAAEYAEWADPASTIIPDPEQARRVDRAIEARQALGRQAAAR
jgi:spermidine synthase